MRLAEQHFVNRKHEFFKEMDELAFKSKNLFNKTNYTLRQYFFEYKKLMPSKQFSQEMKTEEYREFSSKVSKCICRNLYQNWLTYFKAKKAYYQDPSKFLGEPKIPGYKDKKNGRNILIYDLEAISRRPLKQGIIKLSQTNIEVKTKQKNIKMVTIVPKQYGYMINVIYEIQEPELLTGEEVCGIDLGVNTLASLTSDKFRPILINGRLAKSINQFYNKQRAELQRISGLKTSRRLEKVTSKRNHRIKNLLHHASKKIIQTCVKHNIKKIIIGHNNYWKQEVGLGKVNNQNFVTIPFNTLIDMIKYKAKLVGIEVILTEESYTSKASFLDRDPLDGSKISGKFISHKTYQASDGRTIHRDVQGSYNIIRKVFKDFGLDSGIVVMPIKVNPL